MAHLHEMRDSDNHFTIDPATMVITNKSKKKTLQQGDHKCEIYTFEIPRIVEGHDMTLCNLVDIHYINIKGDKTEQSKDIHTVKDIAISEDHSETVVFSWTIHGNATNYAGSLSFRIRFACIDESGEYTYKKHTEIFKGINISEGLDNTDYVEYEHSDIISQWESRFDSLEVVETPAKYFKIDYDGLISLKDEYRGAGTTDGTGGVSDNGVGKDGSKNSELPEIIVIPDVINNIAVSAFVGYMFEGNKRIKSLTIPSGVRVLPLRFASQAINLIEINGTENIETLEQTALQNTAIKKAFFPNLKQFSGSAHFNQCPNLAVVDIGNTVSAIPPACFQRCERLSLIRGGSSVTDIGQQAFTLTKSLKNLPILENVKSIGKKAFETSRVNFDWWNHTFSSVGDNGTPAKYNPTQWWAGCTYEACENPLGSTFSQSNPEWASDYIPNSSDTYGDGCREIATAHIYSALTGVKFDSPKHFVEKIVGGIDNGRLLVPTDAEEGQPAYGVADMINWLTELGLECEQLTATNSANMQKIYDALKEGALVLTGIIPGHVGVIYGVASNGEMLVLDSASYQRAIGNYVAGTFQQPIWSFTSTIADAVIVKKTS